jgi:hypothetical protein
MDVGKGCNISDKWIPKGIITGVNDANGKVIMTADKVQLNGCTSRFAIVGRSMSDNFVLYFGSDNGSVSWNLTQETVDKHKVRVLE